jgi:hypothetical protein
MVGGTIIEVFREPGKTRLWCVDRHGDECAIYIHPFPIVKAGDRVWWQGRSAFLTPAGSNVDDVFEVRRIGFSFDPRRKVA